MGELHQAIIEEIDRRFTTSLGNWTGDAVWIYADTGLTNGVAALNLDPNQTEKSMTLAYPHIVVKPGKQHRLAIRANTKNPGPNITLKWNLTDGIYSHQGEQLITWSLTPTDVDQYIEIQSHFDKTTANLIITASKEVTILGGALYTKWYSLTYETAEKTDHLPLMGVH
jgi:hypothetical protein